MNYFGFYPSIPWDMNFSTSESKKCSEDFHNIFVGRGKIDFLGKIFTYDLYPVKWNKENLNYFYFLAREIPLNLKIDYYHFDHEWHTVTPPFWIWINANEWTNYFPALCMDERMRSPHKHTQASRRVLFPISYTVPNKLNFTM